MRIEATGDLPTAISHAYDLVADFESYPRYCSHLVAVSTDRPDLCSFEIAWSVFEIDVLTAITEHPPTTLTWRTTGDSLIEGGWELEEHGDTTTATFWAEATEAALFGAIPSIPLIDVDALILERAAPIIIREIDAIFAGINDRLDSRTGRKPSLRIAGVEPNALPTQIQHRVEDFTNSS